MGVNSCQTIQKARSVTSTSIVEHDTEGMSSYERKLVLGRKRSPGPEMCNKHYCQADLG